MNSVIDSKSLGEWAILSGVVIKEAVVTPVKKVTKTVWWGVKAVVAFPFLIAYAKATRPL